MPFEYIMPTAVKNRSCPPDKIMFRTRASNLKKKGAKAGTTYGIFEIGANVGKQIGLEDPEEFVGVMFGFDADHGKVILRHINRRESYRAVQKGDGSWHLSFSPLPPNYSGKPLVKAEVPHAAATDTGSNAVIVSMPAEFYK